MGVIKKIVNIASLGVVDNTIPTDVICPEQIGNIPVFENSGYTVIAYSTYKEIFGRLANLLTTGTYYEIRKRGERFVLADNPLSDIISDIISDKLEEDENLLKEQPRWPWQKKEVKENRVEYVTTITEEDGRFVPTISYKIALIKILEVIGGVFENEYWAMESEQCGEIALVTNEFQWFIDTFDTIENAIAFLNLREDEGPTSSIILPIYISQDIFDLGVYSDMQIGDFTLKSNEYPGVTYDFIFNENEENEEVYEETTGVTDYAESKLKTLLREKRSYDNEGNLLPYVIENEGKTNERNELPYILHAPCDIIYENDTFFYNSLEGITYYAEDGNGDLVEDDNSRDMTSPGTNPDGSVIPEQGVIEFRYRVGSSMASGESENYGVLYTERRRYTLEMGENGRRLYINVSNETLTVPAGAEPGVQYAEISDIDKSHFEEKTYGIYVKEPHLIGVHESNIDVGNVYVDRGTSASYEAFNVLGEVNSIDDIEKYRDDWYRIKGKND